MKEHLKATLQSIYLEACNKYDRGEVKEFIGPRGYVVLLQDKLERLLRNENLISDELVDAAVDATLALHFVAVSGILQMPEPEEEIEEEEEEERDWDREPDDEEDEDDD